MDTVHLHAKQIITLESNVMMTGQELQCRHNDNKRNECFRKYSRPEESFYDHSDFLKSVPRYSFLFNLDSTDYKAWAHGLKKAGYATNPDYANMLIRTIEENNLWYFDAEILQPANLHIRTIH